jgi:hypothetical protein
MKVRRPYLPNASTLGLPKSENVIRERVSPDYRILFNRRANSRIHGERVLQGLAWSGLDWSFFQLRIANWPDWRLFLTPFWQMSEWMLRAKLLYKTSNDG